MMVMLSVHLLEMVQLVPIAFPVRLAPDSTKQEELPLPAVPAETVSQNRPAVVLVPQLPAAHLRQTPAATRPAPVLLLAAVQSAAAAVAEVSPAEVVSQEAVASLAAVLVAEVVEAVVADNKLPECVIFNFARNI